MRYKTPILLSLVFLPLLMMLGGCDSINEYRAQKILNGGWVGPTATKNPGPLYCYRTLGTPMCYYEPLPGEEERLIGSYTIPTCPSQSKIIDPVPSQEPQEVIYRSLPGHNGPINIRKLN